MSRRRRRTDRKTTLVIPGVGDPCPRCGRGTGIRAHKEVTEKHLRQPFYYSRWFYCTAPECPTTWIMPERYKVFRQEEIRRRGDDIALDVLDGLPPGPPQMMEAGEKLPWED